MNGYEKRTKIKKDSIIRAAWELFSERGITDVGISEIASKAKVSQVTIYNYFGDKNTLAKEILVSYLDKAIKGYDEILEREIPFSEKLTLIMDKKHKVTNELSRSDFSKYAWEDKTFQQVYKEAVNSKAISVYNKFIELGKKEGAIDESIPTDAILAFLLSSVSIIEQSDYLKTSPEYKNGILRLFFYGLLGKE
ncbi:TetR/AcrR family transcriptional regulator [Irregularibacter muris]|uniref:TetR/AcrR family transcriptional regulator n=1 Tax=Irregularibacter muris TaxID=1796619 RepID=A0AAE3KZB1_9FIRM|nr:TetR/AcrR family transcriptional regulator [Irregularibacter muris]MCR1898920.1 TetR/AcrR family transcriptional regulator [Irregularibacter muris]